MKFDYNGQSGQPFCYVYNGSMIYDYNGSKTETTDMIYVPKDLTDWARFAVPYTDASGNTISVEQQWAALDQFISNDKYLSKRRGKFSERNGAVASFSNQVDLQVKQDFSIKTKENKNTLTVQLDMFNFSNFLNRKWGRVYYVPFDDYALINMDGYTASESGTLQPKLTYRNLSNKPAASVLDVVGGAYNSSRWRGQLTVRYTFN